MGDLAAPLAQEDAPPEVIVMSDPVYVCIRCKFPVCLDDCGGGIKTVSGKTICLRCWDREVGTAHPMPVAVRKAATEAANTEVQ